MPWLSLLVALIKVVGLVASYMRDNQLMKAGEAEATANLLRAQADALHKAETIREAVATDLAVHPDRVQDDDGWKRKD